MVQLKTFPSFCILVISLVSQAIISDGCGLPTDPFIFRELQDNRTPESIIGSHNTTAILTSAQFYNSSHEEIFGTKLYPLPENAGTRFELILGPRFADFLDIDRPEKAELFARINFLCDAESGSTQQGSLQASFKDANTRAPEFKSAPTSLSIDSNWNRNIPINWNDLLIISDKDYDLVNTQFSLSFEPNWFTPVETKLWDNSIRPKSYDTDIKLLLNKEVILEAGTTAVNITALDGDGLQNVFEFNLIVTQAQSPPKFTKAFYTKEFTPETLPEVGTPIDIGVELVESMKVNYELRGNPSYLELNGKDIIFTDIPPDVIGPNNVLLVEVAAIFVDGGVFLEGRSTIVLFFPIVEKDCPTESPCVTESPVTCPDPDCPTKSPTTACPACPTTESPVVTTACPACPTTESPVVTTACPVTPCPDPECPTTTSPGVTDCPVTSCPDPECPTTTSPGVTECLTSEAPPVTTPCPITCPTTEPPPVTTPCPITCPTTQPPPVTTPCPITCPTTQPPPVTTPCPITCPTTEHPGVTTACPTTCGPCPDPVTPPDDCLPIPQEKKGSNTGLIAGIAVISVISVAAIGAAGYFFMKLRRVSPQPSWGDSRMSVERIPPRQSFSQNKSNGLRASVSELGNNGFKNPPLSSDSMENSLEQVLSHPDPVINEPFKSTTFATEEVTPYATTNIVPENSANPVKSALAKPREIDPDYEEGLNLKDQKTLSEKPRGGVRIADDVEIINNDKNELIPDSESESEDL